MTVGEAIAAVDGLKPNPYEQADKLRWLGWLDGRIVQEIMVWHEDMPEGALAFAGYGADSLEDALLAAAPYDEMYVHYLCAQIDYFNAELERYNNSMVMFNMALGGYASWYTRTHRPKQPNYVKTSF